MKRTLLLLLFSYVLFSCTPKHITKQSEITSVVTVYDQFDGKLNKVDVISNPYLTVHNNKLKWKIISYDLCFIVKWQFMIFSLSQEKFSQESMDIFNPASKGSTYALSKAEMKSIMNLLKISDLQKLKSEYKVAKTDQPSSRIIIYTTKTKYVISDYGLEGGFPLQELYKIVYRL